jgi:hypothetical protein
MHSKTAALEALAKWLGMLGEKEHQSPAERHSRSEERDEEVDISQFTADELREMRRIHLAAAARKAARDSGTAPNPVH